ncbi:insecticidal toxin complex protein TccC [Pseudomonas fluorescens]|uniref:RHS repeat-associated core domain-containing protein n=1 Tax=Pseudomonas fluorescens TaxID=294 RepID=UPI0020A1431C|nr:RHS repeat-associated core domain-containing protein [Pseudomonas fluorescens]MCP1489935.1 insecticidal toxin complex protein TccC [Pseudomonas fluorescens]
MSTTSSQTTAQLCSATPTVSVNDNRGLSVRTLQYNRCTVGEAANEWVTQQHFNALGQLISRLDPRFHSAQQSDPAVLPNFSYQNALSGQVLQNHSQDAGRHITLHDVAGGPVWQENSRGFLKRLAYDALHRVSAIFEQDGASAPERVSERFVYGQQAGPFDTFGRLLRHYDTAGLNEVLHYNYRGQPLQSVRQLLFDDAAQSDWPADETQRVTWLEAERYASSITYNALDEVLGTVDALGNQQHRYLDVAGQLARSGLTLAADSEERPVLTSITYSAGGQVLREVAGNGVVSTYTYEPQTLRLSRLTATRPALAGRSTLLQDLNYSYDPVGNILSIDDAAIATAYANNQQVEPVNAYQYDALYQLCAASGRENIGASRQGPILPVAGGLDANQYSNYSRQYRYDRGGNLTQMRHVGFSSYTLDMQVSNTSNRAVAQTGFLTATDVEGQFDAAGNLQQLVAGQPLAWDGRNQLQRVTQIQRSGADDDEEHYQYDGAGARVRKTMVSQTSGTTRRAQVIYLPGLELRRTQRTQGTTTATEEELHVLSLGSTGRQQVRLLHWVTGQPTDIPNNQLRGSLGNQIGSSVLELDQNADVLTQEEYYPFGGTAVWSGKSTSETKYKFVRYSGKERDATGLYYYGFRYYGPWLGRWINPDPGGTVDGLNLYRMVGNNPNNYMDPNGQNRISEEFVWFGHMKALEDASRKGNFAVSFRSAGKATLGAIAKGAAAKGHNILEKTIKKSSIEKAYGADKAPSLLAKLKAAGIEGYVGHWDNMGLAGIYLSGVNEHDMPILPIDINNLEASLAPLKTHANWSTMPFTGDYDMHDLITFRGAGRPRTVLADSKEEKDIIDMMNRYVAAADPGRPFDIKQRNVIRHGPQVNFLSHMLASEPEVVANFGGLLGAVARPGEFPVAMLDRGQWTTLNNIEQLDSYYTLVGARIKESWKPGGVRIFKGDDIVNLGRKPYRTCVAAS